MVDVCPVSVVIPFYNNKRTLVKSVQSVLQQSLPPAELILLDDGSTDGSFASIQQYIEEHPEFKTKVHLERFEKNKGVYPVRNYALDIASQPFVAFHDADDFWHLDKLKIQYNYFAEDDDLYLICSQVGCFEGNPDNKWSCALNKVHPKRLTERWVLWRNVMVTISVMIRNNKEFRFRTDKRRGSDMGMWLSIVLSGRKALYLPEELAFTRKPLFGAGGLSGNLKKAEIAQQRNLKDLENQGYISPRYYNVLSLWSHLKYRRRTLIVATRKSHKFAASFAYLLPTLLLK
jgi:glycosyltransferase involved in cell wall biosynthesis|tara:strand:+ start:152375 stop:153241 length:867 start_codon:yes stop_codon:yes gene_type:complete